MDDPKSGEDSTESPGEELPLMHIHTIQPKVHKKGALLVDINLDGKPLSMEVDTGASVSLISEATWRKLSPNRRLKPSSVRLRTYTGQEIQDIGAGGYPSGASGTKSPTAPCGGQGKRTLTFWT